VYGPGGQITAFTTRGFDLRMRAVAYGN